MAVLECIASILFYVWLVTRLGQVAPLAIAVTCAPLFLLRTRYSRTLALGLWQRIFRWVGEREVWTLIVLVPLMLASGLLVRIGATVAGVFRHPLVTARSISGNWYRQALCTDFFSPPEVVPGESHLGSGLKFAFVIELWRDDWLSSIRSGDLFFAAFVTLWGSLIFVAGYLPAIMLRVSFKASSFVYLPLIWVAHVTADRRTPLRLRLKRITEGELEKTRRWLSGIALSVLLAKILLLQHLIGIDYLVILTKSETIAQFIVRGWPAWQISLVFDAVLTFGLFYYADAVEDRMSVGSVNERRSGNIIIAASFTRGLVAVTTVGYLFSAFAAVLVASVGRQFGLS